MSAEMFPPFPLSRKGRAQKGSNWSEMLGGEIEHSTEDDVDYAVRHSHGLPDGNLACLSVEAVPEDVRIRQKMMVFVDAQPRSVHEIVDDTAI